MAGLFLPLIHPETMARYLFLTVLAVGVFFCGWVCPFGAIQDWLGWVARKLHLPRFQIPWKYQRFLQLSRYIWAGLITFAGVHYAFLNARFYFQDNLIHNNLSWISGITLAVFLIASLFLDRPFCNYFCMKGAVDGLVSVIRIDSAGHVLGTVYEIATQDEYLPLRVESMDGFTAEVRNEYIEIAMNITYQFYSCHSFYHEVFFLITLNAIVYIYTNLFHHPRNIHSHVLLILHPVLKYTRHFYSNGDNQTCSFMLSIYSKTLFLDKMPIQLLPTAINFLGKQAISPMAQNVNETDFIHEISDINSPLYKDVSNWTNADLARAYDSPLYKYNKKLQDKTCEYIQTKWK